MAESKANAEPVIRRVVFIHPIGVSWQPSYARQVQEYKPRDGERAVVSGQMLWIYSKGDANRLGVPLANVKFVE